MPREGHPIPAEKLWNWGLSRRKGARSRQDSRCPLQYRIVLVGADSGVANRHIDLGFGSPMCSDAMPHPLQDPSVMIPRCILIIEGDATLRATLAEQIALEGSFT